MRAAMPRAASSAGVARPTPALLVARGINVSHACLIFKEKRDCLHAMVVVMTAFERFYSFICGRGVLEIAKAFK